MISHSHYTAEGILQGIKVRISWLGVNQGGDCPGWAWPNPMRPLKDGEGSEGHFPSGLEDDANYHVVREGVCGARNWGRSLEVNSQLFTAIKKMGAGELALQSQRNYFY